jgi:hypothetical protein
VFLKTILLDSKHFCLVAGLFGSLKIHVKDFMLTLSAERGERLFFVDLCAELAKRGGSVAPGSKVFEDACVEFCEAISARGYTRWRVYFHYRPSDRAQELTHHH